MPDTGKIAIGGFSAGAIKYVALDGFIPNPSGTTLNACIVSGGFGNANTHKLVIDGFTMPGVTSGAFYIFGDTVIS